MHLKIYGERNTGTNYLKELIDLNINVSQLPGTVPAKVKMIQKRFLGKEAIKDLYFNFTFQNNLGWKHAKINPRKILDKNKQTEKICFVTLTKNPYSWLLSLYNNPYHQYFKSKPSFDDFIKSPWKTVLRENMGCLETNPVELWNLKNRSYLELDTHFNVIHLTYEALLKDPEKVIETIVNKFSLTRKQINFNNSEQSTKESSKDFSYYQDYYLKEKWKKKLSSEVIHQINQKIDTSLVKHFNYSIL